EKNAPESLRGTRPGRRRGTTCPASTSSPERAQQARGAGRMTALEMARRLHARGLALVPVPSRRKRPVLEAWQRLRLTAADLPQHFGDGANIGVLNGAPSGGLSDVDLDDL